MLRANTVSLKLVTPPAETPVSVAEAILYLRIDNDLENTRVETMIKAATIHLENYLGIKFVTQTWDVFMDYFPLESKSDWWGGEREIAISELYRTRRNITLPIGIASQLTEFVTVGDDGTVVSETPSNYDLDTANNSARIGLRLGGVWPTTVLKGNSGIRFRLVVGFGAAGAVPEDIKNSILEMVAHMYENRGDQNEMKIPSHIYELVNHYRREQIGGC